MREPRCIGGSEGRPVATLIIRRYDIFDPEYSAKGWPELALWIPELGNDTLAAASSSSSSEGGGLTLPSMRDHPLRRYTSFATFNHHEFSLKPIHRPTR